MDHLTAEQIAKLRKQLEGEKLKIETRASKTQAELADGEPADPGDEQDLAVEETRRLQDGLFARRDLIRLKEIEAALLRMREGVYGLCEETDDPIPFRRLELEPTTRYTVEALEALERERGDRFGYEEPEAY